jgi:hypothetical protein
MSRIQLLGVAKFSNGAKAEKDIELAIVVLDENDCSPVFQVNQMGSVNESSPAGSPHLSLFLCVACIYYVLLSILKSIQLNALAQSPNSNRKHSTIRTSHTP